MNILVYTAQEAIEMYGNDEESHYQKVRSCKKGEKDGHKKNNHRREAPPSNKR